MNLFNPVTGMLLLLSFPIKVVLQYFHIKSYGGRQRSISNYLFAFPILDNHTSLYKHIVNFLVLYQYLIIVAFFYQNWELLGRLWEEWERIP
jgi:hypothetical protein